MKIDREVLKVNETYIIEKNDTLKIESKGGITEIFINGKKINLVTKAKFVQSVEETPTLEIERMFNQTDFKEIKNIWR